MSLTTDRQAATAPTVLTADERACIVAWGDEHGLEVAIKPPSAGYSGDMAFVGYGEGIASWIVYRSEGHLWLVRIDERAGRGCEGSKSAVASLEAALAAVIDDTEA